MSAAGRDGWASRTGFVLATLGCAVGLGNVWRFAYVAGENGGGAFLVVYAACVLLLGLPLMLAELALGARTRGDVVSAFRSHGVPRRWQAAGGLMALGAFLVVSYYSVIAGWTLRYLAEYAGGGLANLPREAVATDFARFQADPVEPVLWHLLFMALCAVVVAFGVQRGIELASRVLMPLLAALVLLLAGYSLSLDGAQGGVAFLLQPDWSRLADPRLYLAALGQAFFSLGVGLGALATYGSYAGREMRLARVVPLVALGDTLFALVAGLAVFPAVFAFGLDPAQGPALAFVTLPQVVAQMPLGQWFASVFFFLLAAAALTSAVSLIEVVVAYLVRRMALSRPAASAAIAVTAALAGIPSALGYGPLREVHLWGRPLLEAADHFATDLMLPLGGLAVAIFAGWVLPGRELTQAVGIRHPLPGALWLAAVRYLAPAAMAVIFVALALR